MDVLPASARSELMSRVKSKSTGPEKALRRALLSAGLRPSAKGKPIPGTPDLAFRQAKVAVFVDGCFWHGCSLHGRTPAEGSGPYWGAKLASNRARDARVDRELLALGWLPIRIWEHDLRTAGAANEQATRIASALSARE